MKVKRLTYDLMGAHIVGETRHAQDVMDSMGITYKHATPQSIVDVWWFWCPENLPDELPEYMKVTYVNPMKSIGNGVNKKIAKMLIAK